MLKAALQGGRPEAAGDNRGQSPLRFCGCDGFERCGKVILER